MPTARVVAPAQHITRDVPITTIHDSDVPERPSSKGYRVGSITEGTTRLSIGKAALEGGGVDNAGVAGVSLHTPTVWFDPVDELRLRLIRLPATQEVPRSTGIWLGPVAYVALWKMPRRYSVKPSDMMSLPQLETLTATAHVAQLTNILDNAARHVIAALLHVHVFESFEKQVVIDRVAENILCPLSTRVDVDVFTLFGEAIERVFREWAWEALVAAGFTGVAKNGTISTVAPTVRASGCCFFRSSRVAPIAPNEPWVDRSIVQRLLSGKADAVAVDAHVGRADVCIASVTGSLQEIAAAVCSAAARVIDEPFKQIMQAGDAGTQSFPEIASSLDSGEMKKPAQRQGAFDDVTPDTKIVSGLLKASTDACVEKWATDAVIKAVKQTAERAKFGSPQLVKTLFRVLEAIRTVCYELTSADASLLVRTSARQACSSGVRAAANAFSPRRIIQASRLSAASAAVATLLGASWLGDTCAVPPYGGIPASFTVALLHALHLQASDVSQLCASLSPAALGFVLHGDLCGALDALRKNTSEVSKPVSSLLRLRVRRQRVLTDLLHNLQPQLHQDAASKSETLPSARLQEEVHSARAASVLPTDSIFLSAVSGTARVLYPSFVEGDQAVSTEVEAGEGHGLRKELFLLLRGELHSGLSSPEALPVVKLVPNVDGRGLHTLSVTIDASVSDYDLDLLCKKLPGGTVACVVNADVGRGVRVLSPVLQRPGKCLRIELEEPLGEEETRSMINTAGTTYSLLCRKQCDPLFAMRPGTGVAFPSAPVGHSASHARVNHVQTAALVPSSNFQDARCGHQYQVTGWMLASALINRCFAGFRLPISSIMHMVADDANGTVESVQANVLPLHVVEESDPQLFRAIMDAAFLPLPSFTEVLLAQQQAPQKNAAGHVYIVEDVENRPVPPSSQVAVSHASSRAAFVAHCIQEQIIMSTYLHNKWLRNGFRTALGSHGVKHIVNEYQLPHVVLQGWIGGEDATVDDLPDSAPGVKVDDFFRISYDEEFKEVPQLRQYMWEVINGWNIGKQRRFLHFVTGVDVFPPPGTEILRIEMPFSAFGQKQLAKLADTLPQAHSCSNTLEMPNYVAALEARMRAEQRSVSAASFAPMCKRWLEDKLWNAITMSEGYGLDVRSAVSLRHPSAGVVEPTPSTVTSKIEDASLKTPASMLISPLSVHPAAAVESTTAHHRAQGSTWDSDVLLGDLLKELQVNISGPQAAAASFKA